VGAGRKLGAVVRRVPSAGWLCALVAFLSAIAWSLVVPPFQFADEPHHVAYAQYLAETGRPPTGKSGRTTLSQEQTLLMRALRYKQFERRPENRPLTTAADRRRIERALETATSRLSEGGYNRATDNPPLYYALEALAYRASPSTNLLDRIQAMRAISALLAAITVLLVFLFVRELLPGTPWAWTLGGLAVALQPLFANESGAVNSDNLLYPAAAGAFLALAVSFRRGFTVPRGVAIGAMTAVGLLAKLSMLGLVPGIALGLLLLVGRARGEGRRTAVRAALAAVGVAAVPVLAYALVNSTVWDRGVFLGAGSAVPVPRAASLGSALGTPSPTFAGFLSYVWQFYLPRLPFMHQISDFTYYPLGHIWFDGFVGRFGAREYGLPGVADGIAAAVYGVIVILAARELVARRGTVRARAGELATYVAVMLGLLIIIHSRGYDTRIRAEGDWEQARYLFPLLPLYAAIIALAARGAGRRYGPAVAVLIVSLAIAHSLLAFLVTVTRYYG
jgi:4-amino-4-deoxy-L-arabinose transferase-like glycosyltransferase